MRHAACSIQDTTSHIAWTPSWDLQAGVVALQAWIEAELAVPGDPSPDGR